MSKIARIAKFIESLNKIIDDINREGVTIIVEGIRDERALRNLGFTGRIVRFSNSGLSVTFFVEKLFKNFKPHKVLVLSDYDNDGEKLNRKITNELEVWGFDVDKITRWRIGEILKSEGIYSIEDINGLIDLISYDLSKGSRLDKRSKRKYTSH